MEGNEIKTDGGTVITGNASAARDVIGRDRIATQINLANLERLARWLAAALVIGVLVWAVASLVNAYNAALANARLQAAAQAETERQQAEARKVEASRPFLERQLALYTEAAQVAGVLAVSSDEAERKRAEQRFWELYWSEMVMVEDRFVETAMIHFGDCMKDPTCAKSAQLKRAALNLSCEFRKSLVASWGVNALTFSASCQR